MTPEREKSEHIVDLETGTPRVVRVDDVDLAERYLDRGITGVIDPDAVAAERVAEDFETLLAREIDHEEFVNRGREVYDLV